MNTSFITKLLITVGFVIVLAVVAGLLRGEFIQPQDLRVWPEKVSKLGKVEKFKSDQEFREYLEQAQELSSMGFWGGRMMADRVSLGLESDMAFGAPLAAKGELAAPDRVSGTNVQVAGIDEPDIVKTDGKEIFVSSPFRYYPEPIPLREEPLVEGEIRTILPPRPFPDRVGGVNLVKAFPPADLAVDSRIEKSGDLLLSENSLLVFETNKITGFNVADRKNPEESWKMELKNNTQLVTARLLKDKVYIVTRTYVSGALPCPLDPIILRGESFPIRCIDIYHPVVVSPVDSTFTVIVLDPSTGKGEGSVSFVGAGGMSVVAMFENSLYVTYPAPGDPVVYMLGFVKENRDLFPQSMIQKLDKLAGYDLSYQTKLTEFNYVFQKFTSSLDGDERLKIENELENRMEKYQKEHGRELDQTGLVKIDVKSLAVKVTGVVPGSLLNQFALDEYQGNLRIATTVGANPWGFGSRSGSANDVYVLNKDLKIIGSVKDMGLSERIYSVRFVQDKGYVVTFRQTDPFYVLDLSNSRAPQLKGELKIPGFSSYLDPLTEDRVLGVGQEGSKVKISLFDVHNPANPTEAAKYLLDEYWSEIASTHHAFLQDEKHSVFFLPASRGGYIFSYQGDELKLVKAVSEIRARRALYLNDYLYIVGDDKIVVLNEKDWERVNELGL